MRTVSRDWRLLRIRRRRRAESFAAVANVLALHLLVLYVAVVLQDGALSGFVFADKLGWTLLVTLAVVDAALLVFPRIVMPQVDRVATFAGRSVLIGITRVLLVLLWMAIWPFARTVGRSGVVRRHLSMRSWSGSAQWRRSTWAAKVSETEGANRGSGWMLFRVLGWFAVRRSYFTLVLVILLLLVLGLSVLAQTPTLAPFIYTLF